MSTRISRRQSGFARFFLLGGKRRGPLTVVRSSRSLRPSLPLFGSIDIPRVRTIRRLRVLTQREARIVVALSETMFPSEGTGMPTIAEAEVVEYLDDLLCHLELKERLLIRALLALLEVQSLVFSRALFTGTRPRLFSQETLTQREANLKGWENSRLFHRRVVFMAIRTLLLWAYVDSHEAERDMGFVPGTRAMQRRSQARRIAERAVAQMAKAQAAVEHSESGELSAVVGQNPTHGSWNSPKMVDGPDVTGKHA